MNIGVPRSLGAVRTGTGMGRRLRTVLARGFWALLLVNAIIIVALWVYNGGITTVHSAATVFNTIGRITGLLGAYLLLVQVLLLARLAVIERQLGFDGLTVWHRRNGKLCLYLVLAHVVFITAGYTLTDRISLQSEITTLWTSYPGMATATFGTIFIVLVAGTSFVIARRRLRYELWYLVHLLAYAGIVLSWFHQIPTGNELAVNAAAASYWTALYLVTLALLVIGRFTAPALRNLNLRLRVAEVIPEGPNVVSLLVTGRRLETLNVQAGQFFLWRFLTRGRWSESHPFSISAVPDGRSLRITIKSSGDFTSHIHDIKPGARIIAEGPFGVFTAAAQRRDRVALVAGGIGITPLRGLLEELTGDRILIYRVMRESDIVFRAELDRLVQEIGITVHYVVGDHAAPGGERLMSPEHLLELVPDLPQRDIFVCGPPGMMDFLERNIRRAGVPLSQMHAERFAL